MGFGVHPLVHRELQGFLEEQGGILVHAAFVEFHASIEGEFLVGLLQAQVLVLDLIQRGQRRFVVLRLQVHVEQELIGLVLARRIGISLQVVLQGIDRFVVRIQAEVVRELGVVEERILGHLRVLPDIVRLLEGCAGVVLLVQLQVTIGHVVGGQLGQAVARIGHQVELLQGLLAIAGFQVRVAQDVAVFTGHTGTLRALLEEWQGFGVLPRPVVRLTGQAVDLRGPLHIIATAEQGFHVRVQLVVLPLQEEDLGDVDRHHLAEVLVGLQLAETREGRLVVSPFVVDVRGVVIRRHRVRSGPVLHLGELHDGLVRLLALEERVAALEAVLLQFSRG